MAELTPLERPPGMPENLFDRICSDYQRARNTYNKCSTRQPPALPATIARNLAKRNAEHAKATALLEKWSSNEALRQLILTGNASSEAAVRMLSDSATIATQRHNEIMQALDEIRGAPGDTPSSSSAAASSLGSAHDPMPGTSTDIDADRGVELPSEPFGQAVEPQEGGTCIICLGDNPDGPAMPCCWQGENRACKECYGDLIKSEEHGILRCPNCRTPFGDLAKDLQDDAQKHRYKSYILGLPLSKMTQHILTCGLPVTGVSLANHEDFDGNYHGIYHRAFTITSESFFYTPTTVDPLGDDRGNPGGRSTVSLESFSLKGDKFHKFVERACGGIWPAFHEHVEIKYFGLPFPAHFGFEGFKMVPNVGPCICLRVMSELLKEQYEVPLTAIERLRVRFEPFLDHLNMMDKPWVPVNVICNLREGGWDRLWIKSVNFEGYAPQVSLARDVDSPFEKVVDIHGIREAIPTVHMDLRIFFAPSGGMSAVFIGTVELKYTAPEHYRTLVSLKDFKILGCTGPTTAALLNLVDPTYGYRYTIPCEHVTYIWFRRMA